MTTTVYQQVFQYFKMINLSFLKKMSTFARYLGKKSASESVKTLIINNLHNEKVKLL